jgi:hypothetical protein
MFFGSGDGANTGLYGNGFFTDGRSHTNLISVGWSGELNQITNQVIDTPLMTYTSQEVLNVWWMNLEDVPLLLAGDLRMRLSNGSGIQYPVWPGPNEFGAIVEKIDLKWWYVPAVIPGGAGWGIQL